MENESDTQGDTQGDIQGVPQDVTQGDTQGDDLDKWIEYQVAVYPKITEYKNSMDDDFAFEVSVSAMQPCSASFNSLPLPREYNITNMTAAKRYESVWNAFLNELPHNPTATLTSFLKRCNVRQGRMKRWMENNGLSVKEAKKRLRDCQHDGIGDPMSPLSEDSGSLFLPMATDKPAPRSESCDILSGVSLTFPDGTQVNIKRGSAQAVMSFLKLYQREDLPCLD